MLTRATLDLPINPQPPSMPHAGNSGTAAQIARLESQVSFLSDQSNRLLAALQAMWNTLNRDGALAISGATIDGSIIGGAVPAAGTFTDLTVTGNTILGDAAGDSVAVNAATATFAANATRIKGDFINATRATRTLFQNETVDTNTGIGAIANGTGTASNFTAYGGSSDPDNSHLLILGTDTTTTFIQSAALGTGTQRLLNFLIGGTTMLSIAAADGVTSSTRLISQPQTAQASMTLPDGYGTIIPGPFDAATFTIDAGTGVFEVT
jgi:hypothetical protein